MDSFDFLVQSGKSPRKELQGPRPPPLRVRKDSHKIQKPPVPARAAAASQSSGFAPQQPRLPVIIYAVSPKVIHTNPSEFMSLVQRLTGPSPKCAAASTSSSSLGIMDPFAYPKGAVSPAARYASMERAARSSPLGKRPTRDSDINDDDVATLLEGMGAAMDRVGERTGAFPGILSPAPSSLQPIPATFFSPPSDPNPLSSFIHDPSPAVLFSNNKNFNFSDISGLLQSPTPAFVVSPRITFSPLSSSMDLFNNFFDL